MPDLSAIINRFKLPIAVGLLGVVLIIGGIFATENKQKSKDYPKASLVDTQKMISVDISGAVKQPGVYQLQDGARIEDGVRQAGGFAENANQEFISKYLNLAQKLVDGSKVYVPVEGEISSAVTTAGVAGVKTQSKVNVNTSSQPELEALPGIGPVTAAKIISSRPYQKIEDLLNQKVVSKAVFEKIKDQIVVY